MKNYVVIYISFTCYQDVLTTPEPFMEHIASIIP